MQKASKGQPAKGKSPIDKKRVFNTGSAVGSVEHSIQTGKWTLPGKSKAETLKAFRAWQRANRIDSTAMEKWYRQQVQDSRKSNDGG